MAIRENKILHFNFRVNECTHRFHEISLRSKSIAKVESGNITKGSVFSISRLTDAVRLGLTNMAFIDFGRFQTCTMDIDIDLHTS